MCWLLPKSQNYLDNGSVCNNGKSVFAVFGGLPTNPYPIFILTSMCLDINWTILKTLVSMGRASALFKTYF